MLQVALYFKFYLKATGAIRKMQAGSVKYIGVSIETVRLNEYTIDVILRGEADCDELYFREGSRGKVGHIFAAGPAIFGGGTDRGCEKVRQDVGASGNHGKTR
jgi:hypothetical protein